MVAKIRQFVHNLSMLFIFSKFKQKKWLRLSTQKRLKVYNALEKKFAKKQGRYALPVVIHPDDNWSPLGMFTTTGGKKIYIRYDLVTDPRMRFHGMETIFHEGRHAYQYETINKKLPWYAFRAKKWRKNWEGYIPSNENSVAYNNQAVEQDAQKYAFKQMLKLNRKYAHDEAWEKTMRTNEFRLENADDMARKEFGMFYKLKINRMIKKKSKQK